MPGKETLYNAKNEPVELYSVDARDALLNHPDEWSRAPRAAEVAKKGASKGPDAVSSEITTERPGPTRRDPETVPEAQRADPDAPKAVSDTGDELGEDPGVKSTDPVQPEDIDTMSNADLRDLIEEKTGKRPANFVNRDGLLEQAKKATAPATPAS
jgi:hypothetical protein